VPYFLGDRETTKSATIIGEEEEDISEFISSRVDLKKYAE
jgi:hypothetical protein